VYKKALAHFKKTDPKLHALAKELEIADLKQSEDLFRDIAWTIMGQQLSGKAADTIFERFEALFPAKLVAPEQIPKLSDEALRACGLSGAKARAIRSLSEHVLSGSLDLSRLPLLSDAEIMAELTKVKGIGPWTAEMVMIFSLGRPDIFSIGDLVLRKEIMNLHGWKKLPSEKRLKEVLGRWSPFRTYAARILWKAADLKKSGTMRKGKE
jgi:DNA-3-methyladenine glycosylase II